MSIKAYVSFFAISAAVAHAQTFTNGTAGTCCDTLLANGLQHVYTPNDTFYQTRTSSYWSLAAQLHPNCYVQPTSTSDVVLIVDTLVKDPGCAGTQFAVRAGGHMPWTNANNIDNGVTVDLGLMNKTTFDETSHVASIQPGSRWGAVYQYLEQFNYTVAGGRAFDVGVGGFIMGGGNTFFANRFGFGVDNVKNFEVVLASGEVVNANQEENNDLFLVLKGGVGSNYGIITRVDMYGIESHQLWGGIAIHDKSTRPQHLEAHTYWVEHDSEYPPGSTVMAFTYSKALGNITVVNFYQDTVGTVAAPAFDKWLAIPRTSETLRLGSHFNMASEIDIPYGYRQILWTTTVRNDIRIYKRIAELHEQLLEEWKVEGGDPDFNLEVNMQAIARSFTDNGLARGGNIMGLDRVQDNVTMVLFIFAVKTPELEVRATEKLKLVAEQVEGFASSVDGLVEWKHLNYAGGFQDPLKSYGAENLEKMKAASAKYDPDSVFQMKSTPGFKVSKA
ncbi:unnamed protein product [Periconia digitata]|uniref:FAD-binding PCMH-type domain-containing protein n=1 Tax=Periconia digitata TaxID=1303443 RepID=A0A9W4XFE0_9PLEO|nr:unnamed protein product [Periconia digitata]